MMIIRQVSKQMGFFCNGGLWCWMIIPHPTTHPFVFQNLPITTNFKIHHASSTKSSEYHEQRCLLDKKQRLD